MAGALLLVACGDDETTDSTDAPAAETTDAAGAETTRCAGTDTTGCRHRHHRCRRRRPARSPVPGVPGQRRQGQPDRPARRMGELQGHPAVVRATSTRASRTPCQNPDGSSQEELDAVDQPRWPGRHAGRDRRQPGQGQRSPPTRACVEPFEPSTIGEVPDDMKDADGNWVSAYYGIMAIGTNTTIVPERAEDASPT